jgi:hypothetical protein
MEEGKYYWIEDEVHAYLPGNFHKLYQLLAKLLEVKGKELKFEIKIDGHKEERIEEKSKEYHEVHQSCLSMI